MKSIYKKIGAIVVSAIATVNVMALDELNVAYFEEWPMPFEYAKQIGAYDEALGMQVNWSAFGTGTAMSAAMASGDIDISVSQGVPPFIVAASTGQDIQIVDVAVSYADNDNCVVASALEIDASNASELAGKKVSVPIGTAAHYGYLKQMEHFGVSVEIQCLHLYSHQLATSLVATGLVVQVQTSLKVWQMYSLIAETSQALVVHMQMPLTLMA